MKLLVFSFGGGRASDSSLKSRLVESLPSGHGDDTEEVDHLRGEDFTTSPRTSESCGEQGEESREVWIGCLVGEGRNHLSSTFIHHHY